MKKEFFTYAKENLLTFLYYTCLKVNFKNEMMIWMHYIYERH